MKKYRLVISPLAFKEWEAYIDYLAIEQQAPLLAERWLQKSWSALLTLEQLPHRCPPAPENAQYSCTIRMLLVDACLFIFRVDDELQAVRVLDFRHSSQLPRPLDLQDD